MVDCVFYHDTYSMYKQTMNVGLLSQVWIILMISRISCLIFNITFKGASIIYHIILWYFSEKLIFLFHMMPFDIRFLQTILEFKIAILQLFYHFNQYHYLDCVQQNDNLQWTYYEHQLDQSEINISSSSILDWNNQ